MTDVAATLAPVPAGATDSAAIELTGLRKTFGDVIAVDGVDLRIANGEFFSMLGPSGSGKTTVLRMIAGFEKPTDGTVVLDGRDVSHLPPYERDVNTVFQDYALFPHMDVLTNVEYGLRVKKVRREERRRRATEALASVRLAGFGARKPGQLSGGQRQRVALARALVNRPRVLLLDEPLGALDLKLREEMQVELKAIQHEVGITFVFVTHDQHEALAMSDRIAVFNHGRVEQVGSPREIYEHPATSFVAGFVGTTNVLQGEVASRLGGAGRRTIRPEKLRLRPPGTPASEAIVAVEGHVDEVLYLGADTRYLVRVGDGARLIVAVPNAGATPDAHGDADGGLDGGIDERDLVPGRPVQVTFRRDQVFVLAEPSEPTDPEPAATAAAGARVDNQVSRDDPGRGESST